MITGAVIAIVFGKLPLQLIVFAQSITIFVVPFIGIAMYSIANDDKKIMGAQRKFIIHEDLRWRWTSSDHFARH